MTRNAWHILSDDQSLVLTRAVPVRFDVAVSAAFPEMGARLSRRALAMQIRQDMWRRLQRMRGFQPAVKVTRANGAMSVIAGGRVSAPFPKAKCEAVIADMLASPALRQRWARFAA